VGSISPYIRNLTGAIMFLALYLASGGVAGIGEYLTRNPRRAAYRTAQRAHRRAQRRIRRSWPPYERALNAVHVHARSRVREASLLATGLLATAIAGCAPKPRPCPTGPVATGLAVAVGDRAGSAWPEWPSQLDSELARVATAEEHGNASAGVTFVRIDGRPSI